MRGSPSSQPSLSTASHTAGAAPEPRYVLGGPLGSGAAGEVLAGYDRTLGRDVALKRVRPRGTLLGVAGVDAERASRARERLAREATALAQISHPNVVKVFDLCTVDGDLFIAMELAPGRTLRDWLASVPAPDPTAILRAFVAAGEGLAALHAAGIVHRDFKPENVMIAADGRVRICDLGLALVESERAPDPPGVGAPFDRRPLATSTADRGTPRYMSPEQRAGAPLDARSDQYSFCVALAEALGRGAGTGEREGEGEGEKADVALDEAVPLPASLALSRLPRATAVRAALQRGLAVRADERFADMPALLTALAPARRARAWTSAAIGVALVTALLAVALWGRPRAEPCLGGRALYAEIWNPRVQDRLREAFGASGVPDAADAFARFSRAIDADADAWSAAHAATCRASRVEHAQPDAVMDVRMRCLERRRSERRGFLDGVARSKADAMLDARSRLLALTPVAVCDDVALLTRMASLPDDPAQRARALALEPRIAVLHGRVAQMRQKEDLDEANALVVEATAIGFGPLLAQAHLALGNAQFNAGDHGHARETFRLSAAEAEAARDDRAAASSWANLVAVHAARGELEQVSALEPVARAALARAGGEGGGMAIHLERAIAWMHRQRGEYDEALARYGAALRATDGHPELAQERAQTEGTIALVYTDMGRSAEAARHYEASIDGLVAIAGATYPSVSVALNNYGTLLLRDGDVDGAEAKFRRAEAIAHASLSADHPWRTLSSANLSLVMLKRRQYDESERFLRVYQAAVEKAYGPKSSDAAEARAQLGDIRMGQNRAAEARALYEEALAAFHASIGEDAPVATSARQGLARALLALGRIGDARREAQRAVDAYRKQGKDMKELALRELTLADAMWRTPGEKRAARALAIEARERLVAEGRAGEEGAREASAWLRAHEA